LTQNLRSSFTHYDSLEIHFKKTKDSHTNIGLSKSPEFDHKRMHLSSVHVFRNQRLRRLRGEKSPVQFIESFSGKKFLGKQLGEDKLLHDGRRKHLQLGQN
jgi:hypothetical protein